MSKYKYICDMFTDDEDGYTIDCDDMAEEYNKLAKQTEELKSENERLQQQLKDNTKQVREKVCEEIRSRFLATCQIEKGCDTASFSLEVLNRILDQIQDKGE